MNLLKDKTSKLYWKYLFPTIGAALSTSIYILFDTIFIGQGVGPLGLAALNIVLPLYSIYFGTGLLLGIGGSTLLSIERGRGSEDKANKIFTLSISMGLILGIIYTIVGFVFLEDIAIMLGATKDILPLVKEYMIVVVSGTIPFILGNALAAFIRADKAPRKAMIAVISGGIFNITLDYILVFPLDMGMGGAAIATVVSSVVSCIILLTHLISNENTLKFVRGFYNLKHIKGIAKCGIPSLFTEVSVGFVILIFNNQILKVLGEDGVTAYSIISNTAIIAVALFNGICQTIQPLVSINYGASLKERVLQFRKIGIVTAVIVGFLLFMICTLFSENIVRIFVSPTESVLNIAIDSIRLYSIAFLIMGVNMIFGAYFQAVEWSREAFIIVFCRGLLFVTTCVFILPSIIGVNGIWLSVPIGEVLTLAIALIISKKKALNN